MMDDFEFFVTAMPETRPANYFLGCLGAAISMDFDHYEGQRIRLKEFLLTDMRAAT